MGDSEEMSRRRFMKAAAVSAAVMTTGKTGYADEMIGTDAREKLPTVSFGNYKISRLLAGGNPVSGNSHVSNELSKEMADYFSAANIKAMLRKCEEEGVNTWQSRGDAHIRRLLREFRNEGGTIQWIAQTASEFASFEQNAKDVASMRPIGIYHHGSRTDRFWSENKIDQVREDLRRLRDLGVRVGIASHIPEVLEYVEEHDWDVDFYMACFYNVTKKVNGEEAFLPEDPPAMCKFIKETPRQCIAFKILAAGRKAKTPEDLRRAFGFAFANIKPIDVVDVGMFPKYKDQVAENANLVRKTLQFSG